MEEKLLNLVDHFTVTRSFSRKIMVAPYEPADYFASYTAIVKPDASQEELQLISDALAEKAEDDVESKINPNKTVSRRVTMAEIRGKLAQQAKEIEELKKQLANQSAF